MVWPADNQTAWTTIDPNATGPVDFAVEHAAIRAAINRLELRLGNDPEWQPFSSNLFVPGNTISGVVAASQAYSHVGYTVRFQCDWSFPSVVIAGLTQFPRFNLPIAPVAGSRIVGSALVVLVTGQEVPQSWHTPFSNLTAVVTTTGADLVSASRVQASGTYQVASLP